MSSNARPIIIIDGDYNEKKRIVKLQIQDVETKKELTLVMGDDNLGPAFGIDHTLTPFLVHQFLGMLKGKQKMWESHADVQEFDAENVKKMSNDDILKLHSQFDGYAYREILEEMRGE